MPGTCTVCRHPKRAEIDRALLAGTPVRDIATRYPELSRSAVHRHASRDIPGQLAAAKRAEEQADAEQLIGELNASKRRVLEAMDALQALPEEGRLGALPLLLASVRTHVQIADLLLKVELARAPIELEGARAVVVVPAKLQLEEWQRETRLVAALDHAQERNQTAGGPRAEWGTLRRRIVQALQPCPEARRALIVALGGRGKVRSER